MFDRREFIQRGLAIGGLLAMPRLSWAETGKKAPGARTLVLLHLNGGNDGLNTVIPYKDLNYRILRPGIGINGDQIRKVHETYGLHPALSGFENLWRRNRLAIVNGIGYPQPNYSHFRATEIFYTAQPEQTPTSGWMGRAIESKPSTKPLRAVALVKEKPLLLQGATSGVVTMTDFSQFKLPDSAREQAEMYREAAKLGGVRGEVSARAIEALKVANRIAALKPVRSGFYGGVGRDLGKALALLRSDLDLEVIHLSMGGYDTHANQGGQHNGLLAQLGNNIRSFQDQIERAGLGDRVVTCVFSEFGRRATENLSGGTDHGSAYPAFVIGKGVKPGMHGKYPSLEDLDRGNFKYTTDFRSLFAGLMTDFLRLDAKPVVGAHAPLELMA
ncbi:MAG: DUF1501 domain-containing protein [Planctomycetota bacterium]|jgi:uncharacterized protein (DUF1501 family)